MFKLTVYSHNQTKEFSLSETTPTVIGRPQVDGVTLSLDHPSILPVHISIEFSNHQFYIVNSANDPFATLNGNPFGKRLLRENDLIIIGDISIKFHDVTISSEANLSETSLNDHRLNSLLDQVIQTKVTASEKRGFSSEDLGVLEQELKELDLNRLSHRDLEHDEIDALVREVEALEWEEVQALSTLKEEKIANASSLTPSPYLPSGHLAASTLKENKEDFSTETTKEPSQCTQETVEENVELPPKSCSSWKWWLILIGLSALLVFVVLGSFFFYMREKRVREETRAAQGVADIAMALMYARVNHIKPPNHTWSNPSFIKKNLGAVLSPKYQILATLDSQGQLSNSPYLLRIYPNNDLSQFLVIAQPAPSRLQSLFPRTAIVVDSKEMELRKISDLRELNRLLANTKPFSDFDIEASSAIIKNGDLISLNSISLNQAKLGFSPPKTLSILKPGAENRIYNAPRYYLFGERILNYFLSKEERFSDRWLQSIQYALKELERFPNLVLYSTSTITQAQQAQQALYSISPYTQLSVGYLKLNAEGKVLSSQLLMKHNPALSPPSWKAENTEIAVQEDLPELSRYSSTLEKFKQELMQIKVQRAQQLTPLAVQLTALLNQEIAHPQSDFEEKTSALQKEFTSLNTQKLAEAKQQVLSLFSQFTEESEEDLLQIVASLQMDSLIEKPVSITKENTHDVEFCVDEEGFNSQLEEISNSLSLEQLHATIQKAVAHLCLDQLSDVNQATTYKQKLYEAVIQQLSGFLFSPEWHLPQEAFSSTNRLLLESIFEQAWIKDEDIRHYFLNEFDILSTDSLTNSLSS